MCNNPAYAEWIEHYVSSQPHRFVRGKCAEATTAMVEAFPELRRQPGLAHCTWGIDQHWWCVDDHGEIVDPTFEQFQGQLLSYESIDVDSEEDRAKVPTGRCMNCGDQTFNHQQFCSNACGDACVADFNGML